MRRLIRRGQASTETLMLAAVIVIALVFVALSFFGDMGVADLADDVQTVYSSAQSDGSGEMR